MERLDRRPERGGVVRYRVPLTGTSRMPLVADEPNVMGRSAVRIMPDPERLASSAVACHCEPGRRGPQGGLRDLAARPFAFCVRRCGSSQK